MAHEMEPRTANAAEQGEVAAGERRAILINANFAWLWLGQALSGFGDIIFETTLLVWIAADLGQGQAWAAAAVSALLVAQALPVLVVGPVAGALVDRWPDKRHVLLVADLISAGLILVLLPLAGIVPVPGVGVLPLAGRLAAVCAVVLLVSVVGQFFRPAASVVLRDLVPEAALPRAAGATQAARNTALLIGPSLATPLLFTVGATWALVIDALSFIVSFGCNRALRLPPPAGRAARGGPLPARGALIGEIAEGLRFFRQSRVLMTLAIAVVTVMLGAGAINALDVFFVTRNLATPAKAYGFLASAQGAGMVLGAVLWGWLAPRLGIARTLWMGLVGVGLVTMLYARMTSFRLGVITLFAVGLLVPAVNVTIGPIIYRVTPRAYIGRVAATLNPLISAALLVGMVGGGLLYGSVVRQLDRTVLGVHFGPLDTIFLGAGALTVLGGLYAATLRLPDAAPATGHVSPPSA